MKHIKRWLGLAGLVVMVSVAPAQAAQYSGYVCTTTHYTPHACSTCGSEGYITVELTTGPHCTGTSVHGAWFCSIDATSSTCPTYGLRNENQMLALEEQLIQAIGYGIGVTVTTDSTCPSPAWCATHVSFRSN